MKLVPFVAKNAADAVEQIRAQLGPTAVVVNVRKLPGSALPWLGSGPRIEVLACVPGDAQCPPAADQLATSDTAAPVTATPDATPTRTNNSILEPSAASPALQSTRWRTVGLLERIGVLPLHLERVLEALRRKHGEQPPASLAQELALLRAVLTEFWRPAPPLLSDGSPRPHLFIGPAGSGKTTVLCKWLAHAVLLEGKAAHVWRLDSHIANTAESLTVYGEILGTPVQRQWRRDQPPVSAEALFVDLPGVDVSDRVGLRELQAWLDRFPGAHVHLVLNAAYATPLLLAQARAFASYPVTDLILTHLDEETGWGRLWNLVLGTNYSLRFLSPGQNIPGQLLAAEADLLFPKGFGGSTAERPVANLLLNRS